MVEESCQTEREREREHLQEEEEEEEKGPKILRNRNMFIRVKVAESRIRNRRPSVATCILRIAARLVGCR